MRPRGLQYLYLQKPVTLIVIISLIAVLPWIGLRNSFIQNGPLEDPIAISMLESNNWIQPSLYEADYPYDPPLTHWLTAAISMPRGYVTVLATRLPSALAFIVLMASILFFFGRRLPFQQAFVAVLLLITCFGTEVAAMTAPTEMVAGMFIVLALLQLFRWEEQLCLKGLPIGISLLIGCAILTKGIAGLIVPLFIFAIYLLLLRKYRALTIFKAVVYSGVSALFLPVLYYIAAIKQGATLSDLFSINLGEPNSWWHYITSLITGFLPWTIFIIFSLFGICISKPYKTLKNILRDSLNDVLSMEKVKLFSLTALICIFVFYCIPSGKSASNLLPAYPFIAVFLAQFFLYLTEYRTKVTRVFSTVLFILVCLAIAAAVFLLTCKENPADLLSRYGLDFWTVQSVYMILISNFHWDAGVICSLLLVLITMITVIYQLSKKINIKILYATIALTFAVNLAVMLVSC